MLRSLVLAAAALASGLACSSPDPSPAPQPRSPAAVAPAAQAPELPAAPVDVDAAVSAEVARAALERLDGASASGQVTLTATDRGVLISANLSGLPADGLRALHIHAGGRCEAPGPLFNPDGAPLGSPLRLQGRRPAGALGNVRARTDGSARYEHVDPLISLAAPASDPSSVLGRAMLVHAAQDDFHTLPDGAPGPAVACGIIRPL